MNLDQFIQDQGLKQRRIAELTGIAESRLSTYCNGLIPNDDHKRAVIAALRELTGKDISVGEFWPAPEAEKAS